MCRQVLKSKAKTDVIICNKSQKENKLQSHWKMHASRNEGKFNGAFYVSSKHLLRTNIKQIIFVRSWPLIAEKSWELLG